MKPKIHLMVLACCLAAGAWAQTPPTLGLALSGGGAKGLAHVGVIKVLEAHGIVPDYISGTSMGSIAGGLYAIGYTPQQLETLTRNMAWSNYFSDAYARHLLPVDQRNTADRYQLSFAIQAGKLKIPRGLIGGKKILTLLTHLTAPVHDVPTFDQFYIPFRCVATDLETGEAYVFRNGDLRKAIRSSMSIPSAFDPVAHDGKLLVDGLLARNLPVQDVIDMGADITIGVDVGDPLYARDQLNSVLRVLEQTSSYVMAASTLEQRALADFIIDPDLTDYTTLSYQSADSLIACGERAALAALPALLHRLDSLGWKPRTAPERPHLRRDSFPVAELAFIADDTVANRALAQLVGLQVPGVLTIAALDAQVNALYASGFFSFVDYALVHRPGGGGYILEIDAERTPDAYLRGSIGYDVDFGAALLLNATLRNQLGYGSRLSADLRVSEYPGFWLDYAVNSGKNARTGVRLYASGQIIPGSNFQAGELLDEFTFHHYNAGMAVQLNIGNQWHIRTGVEGEHFSENPRFLSLASVDARAQHWRGVLQLIRDTYDRTYFPRDGSLSEAWFSYNLDGKIESTDAPRLSTTGNWMAAALTHKAFAVGRRKWLDATLGMGHSAYSTDHVLQRFYLGREIPANKRFFEVYGLRMTELQVSSFAYGRLQLRVQIGDGNMVGLGYNWGWSALVEDFDILRTQYFQGMGLELGRMTPLGPVRLTVEYSPTWRRVNFSLFAGYRF